MTNLKNLAFAAILAFASFAASAANPAKGIFSDDGEGVKACLAALEALAAGKANTPTYKPLTKNPLTAPDFVKKSIGKGGACLTGAYVQEDEGSKADFATVLVDEDFEYGYKVTGEKIHYRMAKCSNPFKDIRLSAKVEKQPELKAAVSAPNGITVVVNITNTNTNDNMAGVVVGALQAVESCSGNCTPQRKTAAGNGGKCTLDAKRVPSCNFEWRILKTQDQIANCGCQMIGTNRQIIGFMDAQPGSPRCLQQKKLWLEVQGMKYDDHHPRT